MRTGSVILHELYFDNPAPKEARNMIRTAYSLRIPEASS